MTEKEIFRIWAPVHSKWSAWVRPVPFVEINEHSKQYYSSSIAMPSRCITEEYNPDMAVILDLPGEESVIEGLALAGRGYQPIPIFNGTIEQQGARATVDNQSVARALCLGADILRNIEISDNALPVFLLDRNRRNRFKMDVSIFDNSWDVYPQDMPSAEYLINNGIRRILVIGENLEKDLQKLVYEYQRKKIEIYLAKPYEAMIKIKVRRTFYKN